jgi:predicted dienelactone hydrolase
LRAMTRDSSEVLGRPKDVSFALDTAEEWNQTHPVLKGPVDLKHVGVIGHSFGAYTTLVTCEARPALDWLKPLVPPGKGLGPDLSDPRVAAGIALSPQGPGEPFFLEESYSTINRPLLGITGTRDQQQGAPPEHRKTPVARRAQRFGDPKEVEPLLIESSGSDLLSSSLV